MGIGNQELGWIIISGWISVNGIVYMEYLLWLMVSND